MNRVIFIALTLWFSNVLSLLSAQPLKVVKLHPQHCYPQTVPPGNYSGIVRVGDSQYAVVDDKSVKDGFHLFTIQIDSLTGKLTDVRHEGFISQGPPNRDAESIAFVLHTQTLWVVGESDATAIGYGLNGTKSEVQITSPYNKSQLNRNQGIESFCYSDTERCFWTCSEGPLITDAPHRDAPEMQQGFVRITAISEDGVPLRQYAYQLDGPRKRHRTRTELIGVSDLLSLPDGTLLVLEREIRVPRYRYGANVRCRLYQVFPREEQTLEIGQPAFKGMPLMRKHLVSEWITRLTLFRRSFANYEGMCLGPTLSDGSLVVVLVSDSQNNYKKRLKDWWKTIVLKPGNDARN